MGSPVSRGGGSGRGYSEEHSISRAEADAIERLPEVMKEKNIKKLQSKYVQVRNELRSQGQLGRGLQPRHQSLISSTTRSGGY